MHLWWLLEYPSNRKFEQQWGIPQSNVGEIILFMQSRVAIICSILILLV
jgi:hypothetical protein